MNIYRKNQRLLLSKVNSCLLTAVLLLLYSSFALSQSNNTPIKIKFVADEQMLPFQENAVGTPMEFYKEVVRAVDARMPDYDIVIEPTKWTVAKAKIKKGEALGIIGVPFHEHDLVGVYPYSYPIAYEDIVSVCRKNLFELKNPVWPKDYAGLKIGTIKGYDYWLDQDINYREKKIANFLEFPSLVTALNGVRKEVVDCTLVEEGLFYSMLTLWQKQVASNTDFNLEIVNLISNHSIHIGYSEKATFSAAHPYAREFIKAFDEALYQMLRSGELAPLFSKYQVKQRIF